MFNPISSWNSIKIKIKKKYINKEAIAHRVKDTSQKMKANIDSKKKKKIEEGNPKKEWKLISQSRELRNLHVYRGGSHQVTNNSCYWNGSVPGIGGLRHLWKPTWGEEVNTGQLVESLYWVLPKSSPWSRKVEVYSLEKPFTWKI